MNPQQRDAGFVALTVLLALALASVLWAWGLPLGNDGATHVFQAWVRNHYDDADTRYAAYYELLTPVTAGVFVEVQRVLEPLLGWQTAWRVNVVLAAELWAFGFLAFVVRLSRARRAVGLLGFAFALQAALWLGLMPFYYSFALGWFALALGLGRVRSVPHAFGVSIVLGVAAYAHVVPAALVGAALAVAAIASAPASAWPRTLAAWALIGAPALVVATLSLGAEGGSDATPEWQPLLDRLLSPGTGFQSGPRWRELAATLLVALGLMGVGLRARARTLSAPERALAALGCLIIAGTWVLPVDLGTWQLGGIRALPLGVGIVVAFIPVDDARLRRVLWGVIAAYVVSSLVWAFGLHSTLRAHLAPALAGLALPRNPADRVAFVPVDPVPAGLAPVMRFAPLIHISNLYSLARGGADPYGHHGVNAKHQLRLKPGMKERAPPVDTWPLLWGLEGESRAHAIRREVMRLSSFSELVMFGRPTDTALAVELGVEPELHEGGLLIGAFHGCAARIELLDAATALDVRAGLWPSRTPTHELAYGAGPGAPASVELSRFPCGDVWLDVAGALGERCAEASPGLPLRARFTRGAVNVFTCTVVGAPRPANDPSAR